MTYNLAPLFLNSYLNQYIADPLTFPIMLHLRPGDEDQAKQAKKRRKRVRSFMVRSASAPVSLVSSRWSSFAQLAPCRDTSLNGLCLATDQGFVYVIALVVLVLFCVEAQAHFKTPFGWQVRP
jgi:hypothetical protein